MGTAVDAGRAPGLRTAAVRSGPLTRLGAALFAWRFPPPSGRYVRGCAARQKGGRAVDSLPAQFPDGLQPPFFFLLRPATPLSLDRAKLTDLLIDAHQAFAEFPETVKLSDLQLSLAQSGRVRKRFRHRLTRRSASQPELRIVTRIVRLGAMAGWLSTAPNNGGNRAWPQIAQAQELFQKLGALGLQSSKIVGHRPPFRAYPLHVYIRSELWHKKRKLVTRNSQVAHPDRVSDPQSRLPICYPETELQPKRSQAV